MSNDADPVEKLSPTKRALIAVKELKAKLEAVEGARREPIAVVGVGCRMPGSVFSADEYWQVLRGGVDAIVEVPEDRYDVDAYYDPDPEAPGKLNTRWGGYLEDIEMFDARFFGISPREAVSMDPQQRLVLEVGWEALEDAGQVPAHLVNSRTGTFVGIGVNEYLMMQSGLAEEDSSSIGIYHLTGNAVNFAAGRLAFVLGLQGPAAAVDTACSSSLVAVHLACQSLRAGECEMAIAGGVNVILLPDATISLSKGQLMASDGRCKTFDASADGYVRGEGCAMLVLKPLSKALAAGDPIRAVIRGSAVKHDGPSSGLTVPNGLAQQGAIREALAAAGVEPHEVQLIEAHGTGTPLGDPIEVKALGAVLGKGREPSSPFWLGTTKTNIGHLESAAGAAGLVKLVLALQHKEIPPSLNFKEPNPQIPWDEIPVRVPTETMPWPSNGGPRIGGLSAFGGSGINAHMIVQEPPPDEGEVDPGSQEADSRAADGRATDSRAADGRLPVLLPITARSKAALVQLAGAYHDRLDSLDDSELYDLSYTAAMRRSHHDYRLAVVGRDTAELRERLAAFTQGEARHGLVDGIKGVARRRVVLVFPGQGSQWKGMGRQLYAQEPVFRDAIDACHQAFEPIVPWSLREVFDAEVEPRELTLIDVVQPTLFAIQVALSRLWMSWGVAPDAVIGHSMGEIAAAHIAGVLSLEHASQIICRRSSLLRRVAGQGAMAVVDLTIDEAERVIEARRDRVSVAVSNSPRSTVISGDPDVVEEIVEDLERQEVFARLVKVDVASHSPQMDPLREDLLEALAEVAPQRGSVPIYSTVNGTVEDGSGLDREYWVRNLRQPVLFADGVRRLLESGHELFIEVSPHPILLPAIDQTAQIYQARARTLASLRRDEDERAVALETLGAAYASGHEIDWSVLHPNRGRCLSLPTYAWQREPWWFTDDGSSTSPIKGRGSSSAARRAVARSGDHPLLGAHLMSSVHDMTHFWEGELSLADEPFLAEHRVQGMPIFPGAAYVELVLAAGRQIWKHGPPRIEELELHAAMVLSETEPLVVQVVLNEQRVGASSFKVLSRPATETESVEWTLHATGSLYRWEPPALDEPGEEDICQAPAELERFTSTADQCLSKDELYQRITEHGIVLGPAFQGLAEVWLSGSEALARVDLTEPVREAGPRYQVHPALLDTCLQLIGISLAQANNDSESGATYLPVSIAGIEVLGDPREGRWLQVSVAAADQGTGESQQGDVNLLDESGRALLRVQGMRCQRVAKPAGSEIDDWLLELVWQARDAEERETSAAKEDPGAWLLLADEGGVCDRLVEHLRAAGATCLVARHGSAFAKLDNDEPGSIERFEVNAGSAESLQQLVTSVTAEGKRALRGVVHMLSLDIAEPGEPTTDAFDDAARTSLGSVLALVQALTRVGLRDVPRLWLVTAGAVVCDQDEAGARVAQGPLWGMARVITHELPVLRCARADLSSSPRQPEIQALSQEMLADSEEDQLAFRNGARLVARLIRAVPQSAAALPAATALEPAGDRAFRLESLGTGVLDNLVLTEIERRQPGPGEVEVEVRAAGLNFSDVLKAMGIYPGLEESSLQLGGELVGVVTSIGPGVETLEIGDRVMGFAFCCFASHVTTAADVLIRVPDHLGFEEAATIPTAFITAYYAMHTVGHVSQGERVLIHAASGGVGMAAVQLAQRAGAEVLATAGSEEKRQVLRDLGIEHVMDSRSLDFAGQVMDLTDGQGVDAVLNSLSGEAIAAGMEILGPYGRFLEIGKSDIYQNSTFGLAPFRKNLTFSAIDLDRLSRERPWVFARVFAEIMDLVEQSELQPLQHRVFKVSEATDAFRLMAQARHTGKVVISLDDDDVRIRPADRSPNEAGDVREDGTYLITGGLGGLGLVTAAWLVDEGARHLVLTGRSGPSDEAREVIARLEQAGASVRVVAADVNETEEMRAVLEQARAEMPPLRGVFHSAGVLDDGVLLQQTIDRYLPVLRPKVAGAWNLHVLTLSDPIEHFVLFSSAASMMGSPGQSNHSAANAFLDALAHYRHQNGLPALSINWGPWSEVGAAARPDRGERLGLRGVASISPAQGVEVMRRLLGSQATQVAVMPFNLRQWRQFYPQMAESPLITELVGAEQTDEPQAGGASAMKETLLALAPADRLPRLESLVLTEVATVLRLPASQLDAESPLGSLGFDSLMALELRNRLEAGCGLTLSATLIWSFPTISALARHLAEKMRLELTPGASAADQSPRRPDGDPLNETGPPEAVLGSDLDGDLGGSLEDLLQEIDVLSPEEALRQLRGNESEGGAQ